VISPESVASANCQKEIDHASRNNKRLIPLFHRDVPDKDLPEPLAKINRIFFRDSDDFEATFAALIKALDEDLDWKRAHGRLLVRAKDWEGKNREKSFLLRGKDLQKPVACE
jgi:TIR domain-containing protein